MQQCVKSKIDVLRKEVLNVFSLIGHLYKDWQMAKVWSANDRLDFVALFKYVILIYNHVTLCHIFWRNMLNRLNTLSPSIITIFNISIFIFIFYFLLSTKYSVKNLFFYLKVHWREEVERTSCNWKKNQSKCFIYLIIVQQILHVHAPVTVQMLIIGHKWNMLHVLWKKQINDFLFNFHFELLNISH